MANTLTTFSPFSRPFIHALVFAKSICAAFSEVCACAYNKANRSRFYSAVLCLTREPRETWSCLPDMAMFSARRSFRVKSVLFNLRCMAEVRGKKSFVLYSYRCRKIDLITVRRLHEADQRRFPHRCIEIHQGEYGASNVKLAVESQF